MVPRQHGIWYFCLLVPVKSRRGLRFGKFNDQKRKREETKKKKFNDQKRKRGNKKGRKIRGRITLGLQESVET